jgi:hypothetical protein
LSTPTPTPWQRYRQLLRNGRFLRFEGSAIAASVGYSVYAISIPWLALTYSRSLLLVGLVLFVEYGVYALTFVIAPWVDRARNKRTIYLVCYPLQAATAAAIGIGLEAGTLTPGLLLGLVAIISLLWDFAWAANNVVPRLLLDPDDLFRAQGLGSLLGGAAQAGGYAVGAVSLVAAGPAGGMVAYAGLLLAGTVIAATVSLPSPPPTGPPDYWKEFRSGWAEFSPRARGPLVFLGSAELVRGFFVAAPPLLITLVASRVLVGGASGYSELYAAWVAGGIAVGLLLGTLNPRRSIGAILLTAAVAESALIVLAGFSASSVVAGGIVWFAVGAAGSSYLSAMSTFLQGTYPPETLGRVTGNLYLFTGVASAAGAALLGDAAVRSSPLAFGALVGGGFLLLAVLVAALPPIRRMAF